MVLAALVSLVAYLALIAGPQQAQAHHWITGSFCNGWRAAYGHQWDSCSLPVEQATHIKKASVTTYERAGCVRFIGYYGEPVSSWACTGNYSIQSVYHPFVEAFWRAELRNNGNTTAWFNGFYETW